MKRQLTLAIQRELDRRRRRRDRSEVLRQRFRDFSRESWHVVEPAKQYIANWHSDAIADHLQGVRDRQIQYLLINVPPGHAKSLYVAVQFPAWLWIDDPQYRLICGTYSSALTVRDAVRSRDLITSPWYQETFAPTWRLKDDSNAKDEYYTTETGFRVSVSVTGRGTGLRGNGVILDDVLSVEQAHSEAERMRACRWVSQTMSSRRNDLARDWQIAIGQRLHEKDPYGEMLASGDYVHLCLPSEYEPQRRCVTSLGWSDPRTEPGELLFPALFPRAVIEKAKRDLGSYAFAGQHQQKPSPAEGGIFQRAWFSKRFDANNPPKFDLVIQSWDCAFKEKTDSDYVAGGVLGLLGPRVYLLDLTHERLGYTATKQAIRDKNAEYPECSHKLIEDKANGSAVIEELRRDIPGIVAVEPDGGKIARAYAASADLEAGNLFLPEDAPWVGPFIEECCAFPNAAHDDRVDMLTQAINWRRRKGGGLLALWKAQAEAQKKDAEQKPPVTPAELAQAQKRGIEFMQGPKKLGKVATAPQTSACPQCGNKFLSQFSDSWKCGACGASGKNEKENG